MENWDNSNWDASNSKKVNWNEKKIPIPVRGKDSHKKICCGTENRCPELFLDLGYDTTSEISSPAESMVGGPILNDSISSSQINFFAHRIGLAVRDLPEDTRSVQSLPLESICEGSSQHSFEYQSSLTKESGWDLAMQNYSDNLQHSTAGVPPACIDRHHLEDFVSGGMVNVKKFISALDKTGINVFKDIRFQTLMDALAAERSVTDNDQIPLLKAIPLEEFEQSCRPSASLINQALSGELILPDFVSFCKDVKRLFHRCDCIREGEASNSIIQPSKQPSDLWSVSICTVDGQRMSVGNHTTPFTMQSLRDVLIYTLAITDCGEKEVHSRVGKEPAGDVHDSLVLDRDGLPHNAMIPAGALAVISLLKPDLTLPDRFDYLFGMYERLAGFEGIDFSNTNYLAEKMSADHIYSIAYHLMGHSKVFPRNCKIGQTIDLYLQLNSIECTTDSAATIAATLANGGICPFTAEAVYSPEAVRNALSVIHSCGVRKISGKWSFDVGLPAKSTTSGAIMIIVPDVMGIVMWSPLLDKCGNSVRGVAFSRMLTELFSFHTFENPSPDLTSKINPVRKSSHESKDVQLVNLLIAANKGDLPLLIRYYEQKINFNWTDYDGRTALHLGIEGGHLNVVKFLVEKCLVDVGVQDRWGHTPLEEAVKQGNSSIIKYLLLHQNTLLPHMSSHATL
ncbi:hypothetical protein ACHWQZ_G017576 [Mnemiopsis leidyi]